MSVLFTPIRLRGVEARNRVWVAPMCQYSADNADGVPTDWHLVHLGSRAVGGAGLVMTEATAVTDDGRITPWDLGLYNDTQVAAFQPITRFIEAHGAVPAIQLAHAGRKASNHRPWEGSGPLKLEEDAWPVVSCSALAYADGWQVPHALNEDEIEQMIGHFVQSAKRAERAGFDFIELHSAHGYLLHQFLSPLSNHRTDRWGGSLENRMRFAMAIARRVTDAVPNLMLGARMSLTDWVDGGFTLEEAIEVARSYREAGIAYICCSSGGNSPQQSLRTGPGYQVHLAEAVKKATGIPVRAVGMIDQPVQADAIIREGQADMVALGRALLADPRWPWRAAARLGHDFYATPQLARSAALMKQWGSAA